MSGSSPGHPAGDAAGITPQRRTAPQASDLYARLVRELTPRRSLRVDTQRPDGSWAHSYDDTVYPGPHEPAGPYAMYLADGAGVYRWLAFDLDHSRGGDEVDWDVSVLRELLDEAGVPHVLVASGPGPSRHVWIRVPDGLDALFVHRIATAAARTMCSLDTSALTNPRMGCIRPPGAPHRRGGRSRIIGDVDEAVHKLTVGAAVSAVERFAFLLGVDTRAPSTTASAAPATSPAHGGRMPARVETDPTTGMLRIIGPTRSMSASTHRALTNPLDSSEDTSARLGRVLCGLALARWSYSDVVALSQLSDTQPGFTHVHTQSSAGASRLPRAAAAARQILERQWNRAVLAVAERLDTRRPHAGGVDDDYTTRVTAVCAAVEHTQQRADASPGRWAQPGGPSDRRVLDQLCLLQLTACQLAVEADIRRLALACGISRECVRVALSRLARDGWITCATESSGRKATRWELSTEKPGLPLSQGAPRPALEAHRSALLDHLTSRLALVAHDVFAHGSGLGHHVSRTYIALIESQPEDGDEQPQHPIELAAATGYRPTTIRRHLELLDRYQLTRRTSTGWITGRATLNSAAQACGSYGTTAARARRYGIERDVWDWWCAEVELLRARRDARANGGAARRRPGRAAGSGQIVMAMPGLPPEARWPRYPRTGRHRRPDHTLAADLVRAGTARVVTAAA